MSEAQNKIIYRTKKEGRYLIRIIGAGILMLLIIGGAVRDIWFLTPEQEPTPWFIFLIVLVIAILIFLANWVFWDAYLVIYPDRLKVKGYKNQDPEVVHYTQIASVNGVVGSYIDLPGIDRDKTGTLTLGLIDGTEKVYAMSCSRKSFEKVLEHLFTQRKVDK